MEKGIHIRRVRRARPTITTHDRGHVRGGEEGDEVVDDPGDGLVHVFVEVAEEAPEERVRAGDEGGGLGAGEVLGCGVVEAGGEHAVDDRLGVDVGERFDVEVVDEPLAEREELLGKRGGGFFGRAGARPSQSGDDGAGEEAGLAGHEAREARRRRDGLGRNFGESAEKGREPL